MSTVPLEPMELVTWERDRDAIEGEVAMIRRCGRSSKVGRATLLLAVHSAGGLVAEIVRTSRGPVVVTSRSRGGDPPMAPLTADPDQTFPVEGFQPLTAAMLFEQISNGTRELQLLTPTTANQERVILGYGSNADPVVRARSQVERLRGAVKYRREQGHDAAQIAGTEEYLAQAEAELATLKHHRHHERR